MRTKPKFGEALSAEKRPKSRRIACRSYGVLRLLRQRMQVAHQALQPLLDHMGVDLGRGDIGVAEQGLHDAQVRAVVQEVAGEGVAQHVWRNQARLEPRGCGKLLQVAGKMLPRQMSTLAE